MKNPRHELKPRRSGCDWENHPGPEYVKRLKALFLEDPWGYHRRKIRTDDRPVWKFFWRRSFKIWIKRLNQTSFGKTDAYLIKIGFLHVWRFRNYNVFMSWPGC